MMEVELKKHSWGERAIVTMDDGSEVEVMRFDSAGSNHTHAIDEIATCISGQGYVYVSGIRFPAGAGLYQVSQFQIAAGDLHYMEPNPDYGPFEWIIRYAS